MGRPKGSRNKTRAERDSEKDGGPLPPNGIGHNGGPSELTDEQKQVLWFEHQKKVVALRKRMENVKADLRNTYKVIRSELGFTKADIDFALRLLDDEDDELLEQEKRRRTLARWLGHAIGFQEDLFEPDRTPLADRAFADGRRAGLAGDPCTPAHAPETEAYRSYMQGFNEGQSALLTKGIKPTAPAGAP